MIDHLDIRSSLKVLHQKDLMVVQVIVDKRGMLEFDGIEPMRRDDG